MRRPPRLAATLLRWSLPDGVLREAIVGDLHEEFCGRSTRSSGRARAWYWREVFSVIYQRATEPIRRRLPAGGSPLRSASSGPGRSRRVPVNLGGDLRYAMRNLLRTPVFSAVAIVSLTIGIGATTVIFSTINALFLRPPAHVENPDALISVFTGRGADGRYSVSSYPDFLDIRSEVPALDDVASYILGLEMNLSRGDETRLVFGEAVSANYFELLGVTMHIGGAFSAADVETGSPGDIAVIGYGLWQREFGGNPDVLQQTMRINGRPLRIVGVAPAGLRTLEFPVEPDIWVPLSSLPDRGAESWMSRRGNRGLNMVGRLAAGATLDGARRQLDVLAAHLGEEYPRLWRTEGGEPYLLTAIPASRSRLSPNDRAAAVGVSTLLMVTVLLVLTIACSNLAGLLLSRASSRQAETAVRLALGASRARLVGLLLTESLLLAAVGGTLGIVCAHILTRLVAAGVLLSSLPFQLDLTLDGRVLLFAVAVSTCTGVLFGLAPALQGSRPDLLSTLKSGRGGSGRRRILSLRNGLIVAQVALSLVLLVTASLFLRSLQAANQVDVGFNPDNVAMVHIDLTQRGYQEEQQREFFRRLRVRVGALPNVTEVALAALVPLGGTHERWAVEVEGFEAPAGELAQVGVNAVSPGYLELMQMRLLSGRSIEATDRPGAPPIAVVNEAFARLYSPAETPLGKHIRVDDSDIEIVGVAATAKYRNLSEEPEPRMWMPLAQHQRPRLTLLARTAADPTSLLPLLRREVLGLDAELPLRDPALLEQNVATSMLPQQTASAALGSAGIVALVLAVIGIYGVVAVTVVRRTPELGVRIALGARRGDIVRMIIGEALAMVATGMAIGFAMVIAVTRLLTSVLMGVSPIDPLALLGGAALLGLAALLASLVPGLRASRVDPLVALRYE